ncbi:unnamed protein product [Caenorhabditis bovis]|uniref:Intraflagellar transport protein 74 homolog n=1 Tax=Caenorhabditis bovis TaxID=2654633 RepID=A0A8S1EU96_9PELO|nr:unnamed protein product [Caenorhabditis bovis]
MARPPTSALRPVTQQGLRAPTRLGTAGNRQVFDKSYFIGLLRSKINLLNVEIGRLREKKEKAERDRNELHAYESRAQAIALEIRDFQGKLVDLNVIVDRMHMNGDVSDLEIESAKMKDEADELQHEVEDIFRTRQEKEEIIQQLQSEIEEQKGLNETITAAMDPTLKERFEGLKSESESLRERVSQMEHRIDEMDDNIARYQMELDSNPLKKKAVVLQDSIANLRKKEDVLLKEKESKETPEQRKENMVETMKQLNADIAIIEKQHDQLKDQISMASEELHEYESQGEAHHIKHHAQYLELLAKDHQIEDLLQTYPRQLLLLQQDLEEYSSAIVLNLKKISANIKKLNIGDQVTDLDEEGLINKLSSSGNIGELKDLHVRLQEEMISLEEMETALKMEIEQLEMTTEKDSEIVSELQRDAQLGEEDYKKELEEKLERLQQELPQSEEELNQLEINVENVKQQVLGNPANSNIKRLTRLLNEARQRVAALNEDINAKQKETDYESIKEETLKLRGDYNVILQEKAGRQHV